MHRPLPPCRRSRPQNNRSKTGETAAPSPDPNQPRPCEKLPFAQGSRCWHDDHEMTVIFRLEQAAANSKRPWGRPGCETKARMPVGSTRQIGNVQQRLVHRSNRPRTAPGHLRQGEGHRESCRRLQAALTRPGRPQAAAWSADFTPACLRPVSSGRIVPGRNT